MSITFIKQPESQSVVEGQPVTFSVVVTGIAPTYQWNNNATGAIPGATESTYTIDNVTLDENGEQYVCVVSDSDFDIQVSDPATLTVTAAIRRVAMVYNYEDDNFSWMDASGIREDGGLAPAVCMKYQFGVGKQVRWSDLEAEGTTWADLQNDLTKWSDFYDHSNAEAFYYLTRDGVFKADQVVDTSGAKQYYVERTALDFSDVIGGTSNAINYLSQMYFHLESAIDEDAMAPNTCEFTVGWSNSLMDKPKWDDPVVLNIQKLDIGGAMKWDLRSSGRYLAWRLDFTRTDRLTMTGADINIAPSAGR